MESDRVQQSIHPACCGIPGENEIHKLPCLNYKNCSMQILNNKMWRHCRKIHNPRYLYTDIINSTSHKPIDLKRTHTRQVVYPHILFWPLLRYNKSCDVSARELNNHEHVTKILSWTLTLLVFILDPDPHCINNVSFLNG